MKLIAASLLVALAGATPAKIDVGVWTYGLASGGASLWAGSLSTSDVLRIDPKSGKVLARVTAGARIFNLAAAPGAVWAVGNVSGTIARIDTRTAKVTKTVQVGLQPYDVEWGFGSAWVSNAGDGTVWRITKGRVVKKIKVGVEPNGFTAYGGALWVGDHTSGKVVRIDPETNRITGTVKLAGADWITGYGDSIYVSQETSRVARISVKTLKVLGTVATARNPLGSAIVGKELWVPCIDANEIDVVDPAAMKVVARKKVGRGPIVVLPAFGHEWLSNSTGNAIWRL
jgi:DNA-binding beta-propeller fold protein YncE